MSLQQFLSRKEQLPKPKVVCLCGSTRFSQAFAEHALYETLAGHIVLTVGCDTKSDDDLLHAGVVLDKDALDVLHLFKIEMASEVLVLNVGGYIGESTRREVEYAYRLGKRVRWLETPTHCNNTSVGVLVEREERFLLFRRVQKPYGIAPSAGHVDELHYVGQPDEEAVYEHAAYRELQEETRLTARKISPLLEIVLQNQCRRCGGDWHKWRIYRAEVEPDSEPYGTDDESLDLRWYCRDEIIALAQRTKLYQAGSISEEEWETCPGLEPVWLHIFNQVGMLE